MPLSTKLSKKHPWVKENQIYINERRRVFPKEVNNKLAVTNGPLVDILHRVSLLFV